MAKGRGITKKRRQEWLLLAWGLLLVVSCVESGNFTSRTGIKFILVDAGSFMMGSNAGEDNSEVVRKVTLTRNYYISETEITFELFSKFWKETKEYWDTLYDFGYGEGKRPAIGLEWIDAVRFCNWLSKKDGLKQAYNIGSSVDQVTWNQSSTGYRLPTEAEWEYAARGGSRSKGFRYAGSDNPDEVAWYGENSGNETHLVGLKKPNEIGLYDMSGNVDEICWDWFEFLGKNSADETDPQGPTSGDFKVGKGGSHMSNELELRTANRAPSFIDRRTNGSGFRIVRYSKPDN